MTGRQNLLGRAVVLVFGAWRDLVRDRHRIAAAHERALRAWLAGCLRPAYSSLAAHAARRAHHRTALARMRAAFATRVFAEWRELSAEAFELRVAARKQARPHPPLFFAKQPPLIGNTQHRRLPMIQIPPWLAARS